MLTAHITVDMVATWAIVVTGAVGYVIAAKFAGKPTALAYAEQEVKRLELVCSKQADELKANLTYIAVLEARTDIAKVMSPLLESLVSHESNAERRSGAMLDVMNQIAGLLGSERSHPD